MSESEFEREQEEEAAAEAGAIGGRADEEGYEVDGEPADPAQIPLAESGEGESEGFELAEQELIEHSQHTDQHAARRIIQDAPDEGDERTPAGGEADFERSSELSEDE